MAFADSQTNGRIDYGEDEAEIELAGVTKVGDCLGWSDGWKRALATSGSVIMLKCIAGEDGSTGQNITAYFGIAIISGERFSGATLGGAVYVAAGTSNGKFTQTKPTTAGDDDTIVGWAIGENEVVVVPNQNIALIASSYGFARSATLVVAASDATSKEINQADYICDGTADDVQIQAALDALPTAGGLVSLSTGNFSCTTAIALSQGQVLKGQGRLATVLAFADGIDGIDIVGTVGNLIWDAQVEDLRLNSAGTTTSTYAIKLNYTRHAQIKNVFTNFFDGVLSIGSDEDSVIERVYANYAKHEAVILNSCLRTIIKGSYLDGEYASEDEARSVLRMISCQDCIVEDSIICNVRAGGLTGYYVIILDGAAVGNKILRNYLYGAAYAFIYARGSTGYGECYGNVISGNDIGEVVSPSGSHGILMRAYSENNFIAENTFREEIANPVWFTEHARGNIARNNRSYAVGFAEVPIAYDQSDSMNQYDHEVITPELDLTAAGVTHDVFYASCRCQVVSYRRLVTADTSSDTGVALNVGKYGDTDYIDTTTSPTSQVAGYSDKIDSAALTKRVLATGEVLTAGTVGLKAGTGKMRLIIQIAEVKG